MRTRALRGRVWVAAVAVLATGLVTAMPITAEAAAKQKGPTGVLRYTYPGTVVNPQQDPIRLSAAQQSTAWAQFDSLVFEGAHEKLSADGLATSWKLDDAAKTVTLSLRKGVKFTDGTPFDANAVKANMDRGKALTTSPYQGQFYSKLNNTAVVDQYTAKLTFDQLPPDVLLQLARPVGMMLSPTSFSKPGFDTNPVGTGPYQFDSANSNAQKQVYKLNADYWNPSVQKVKEVDFIVLGSALTDAALNAIQQNQLDVGGLLQTTDQVNAAKAAGAKTIPVPNFVPWTLWIPDHDGKVVPELADPKVREAMALAIDAKGYNNGPLAGWGTVQNQLAYEGNPFWYKDLQHQFDYNLAKAKQLMAGRTFSCTTPVGVGTTQEPLAQYMKSQLAQIGITLNLDNLAGTAYLSSRLNGNYPCVVTTMSWQDPANNYATFFQSPAIIAKYGTMPADIDALAAKGASTPVLKDRLPIYHDLFTKLFDAHYLSVFYVSGAQVLYRKGVTGITPKSQVYFAYDPRGVAVPTA